MSNLQSGTRGMSASDWIRMKRSKGADPSVTSVVDLYASVPTGTPINNSTTTREFVIACIDPRFAHALEQYLNEILVENGITYDLFILAGAAGGAALTGNALTCIPGGGTCSIVSVGNNWRTVLLEHIQVAITLHNISKVLVVDHLDCGAYKNCVICTATDQTPSDHQTQFNNLSSFLNSSTFYANGTSSPTATVSGSSIFTNGIQGLYFNGTSGLNTTSLFNYSNALQRVSSKGVASGAKVLVLGCIDPRFSTLLSSFLTGYKDVQFIYDLFILAGSSLGANQSYTTFPTTRTSTSTGNYAGGIRLDGTNYIGNKWGPTFFDHLSIARLLHTITEVWVFDHLDCGAYKNIKFNNPLATDLDPNQHTTEITTLQGYINTYTSTTDYLSNAPTVLGFKGFVMDTGGVITKVVDNGIGTQILLTRTFGTSRIRNPASDHINKMLWKSTDYVIQKENASSRRPQLTVTKLCYCETTSLTPRTTGCIKCSKAL
jgi:hypothetical protein